MHVEFSENVIKEFLEIGEKLLSGIAFHELYHNELINHSRLIIFWKNMNSTIMGCNKNFSDAMGANTPQLLVGKSDYQFCEKKDADLYRKNDLDVLSFSKEKINCIEPVTTKFGNFTLLTSKFPIYSKNKNEMGVLGISTDISEHKFLENSLMKIDYPMIKNLVAVENLSCRNFSESICRFDEILKNIGTRSKKYIFLYEGKEITLSPRELQCIALLLKGKTVKKTAEMLNLSPRTIESHWVHIKSRFNCKNKNKIIEIILSDKWKW